VRLSFPVCLSTYSALAEASSAPREKEPLPLSEQNKDAERVTPDAGKSGGIASSIRQTLKHRMGLDRAVAFAILARCWAAIAGVVSVLLIARFLSPNEQGYYYTFYSMVTLTVVFELGFSFVVLQMAAHERAQLKIQWDGTVQGDPVAHSRLASVLQKSVRWYFVAALLMVTTLTPTGLFFFSANQHVDILVDWKGPWCLLAVVAVLDFLLAPICGFVEGCGFVPQIAKMRFGQAVLGSTMGWMAMLTHHGLYAPAMLILGQGLTQVVFLTRPRIRHMLVSLLLRPVGANGVNWREEIWPFQWRIAVTWLSSYFISQLFNPILFMFRGPAAAGRMGMSLSIAASIGTVGVAWMSTKASPFGNFVARGEIRKLNHLFFRTLWQSMALLATGAAGIFLCVLIGGPRFPRLAMRVLPPWALALLLLTTLMNHVLSSEALYLRAHKKEPFLPQAVVVALVLAVTTPILAKIGGANGVTLGYFLFGGLLSLTWGTSIFIASRREWYGNPRLSGEFALAGKQES